MIATIVAHLSCAGNGNIMAERATLVSHLLASGYEQYDGRCCAESTIVRIVGVKLAS